MWAIIAVALVVLADVNANFTDVEVTLRDLNTDEPLPDLLEVSLEHAQSRRDAAFPQLRLRRNTAVENVPFTVDDVPHPNNYRDVGFYQDLANHAIMTVRREQHDGSNYRTMRGSFMMDGRMFEIVPKGPQEGPPENNEDKRNLKIDAKEGPPENNEDKRNLKIDAKEGPPENNEDKRNLKIDAKEGPPEDNEDKRNLKIDAKEGPPEDNEDKRNLKIDAKEGPPEDKRSLAANENIHVVRELKYFFDTRTPTDYQVVREEDSHKHSGGHAKRALSQYLVEMMWVVDSAAWEIWKRSEENDMKNFKEYFAHQMNGVDMAYHKIQSSEMSIAVTVTKIKIYTTVEGFDATNKSRNGQVSSKNLRPSLNNDAALTEINAWRTAKGYKWYNPDHLMAWTGYDLLGCVVGYAPVSGICQVNRGHSVLELRGWDSWSVAAHELGHNLGMRHDGSNGCSKATGNLMGDHLAILEESNKEEPYRFSPCSVEDARKCLKGEDEAKYPRICLEDNYCRTALPAVKGLPGETVSVTSQCKDVYGKESTGGCSFRGPTTEKFCMSLWCAKSMGWCTYGMGRPVDGTPCGAKNSGKWCIKGYCVEKGDKPERPKHTCEVKHPIKDIPATCKDQKDKREICQKIALWPGLNCSDSWGRSICCSTCASFGFK